MYIANIASSATGAWFISQNFRFAVGRPWVRFPRRIIPKDFKSCIYRFSAWRVQY